MVTWRSSIEQASLERARSQRPTPAEAGWNGRGSGLRVPLTLAALLVGCGQLVLPPGEATTGESDLGFGAAHGALRRATATSRSRDHHPEFRRQGGHAPSGEDLFRRPFPRTNGRSCATCHVPEEHTTLTPEHVERLLEERPEDPLFSRLDADDPDAEVLTFEHLKRGLVRVVLDLPDNLDLIDDDGQVVTPVERTLQVWRGVPSIENTALSGPFQYDGREQTLQSQAQSAISFHSEGPSVKAHELDKIAEFERTTFTSERARFVADELERGKPLSKIRSPEASMRLSAAERRGRAVYERACEACHGGPTTGAVVNRAVHDLAFPVIKPDGNLLYTVPATNPPTAVLDPHPEDEFLNLGFALQTELGQLGLFGTFNAAVEMPRYRYRFYTDGSRTEKLVDLPPPPVTVSGDPLDLRAALDADGNPIVGPNLLPQRFSTDPGRALISGDPSDFEAFDVPQLRGIASTAPYFHDNSSDSLEDVVDKYSRFIVQAFPPLELPLIHPPEVPGGFPESLTTQEKQDLIAFLRQL